MKTNLLHRSLPGASLVAGLMTLLLLAPCASAVNVILFDSIVSLAASGTNYYTFKDPVSGESVIVALTMTPVSNPPGDPFTVVAPGTEVGIGLVAPDANTINASEGVDFSASLVFASTGVIPGSVAFRIGGLGLAGVPNAALNWGSSSTPPWKPVVVAGPAAA